MNINNDVEITLTEYGKHILDNHRKKLEKGTGIKLDIIFKYEESGVYKAQLWELMNIFGSHIYNGAEQVFVNNEIKYLDDVT